MKNTDAMILMQFRDSVEHLKGKPLAEIQGEMLTLGKPYLDRLQGNGHDLADALGLMRAVWNSIEKGI